MRTHLARHSLEWILKNNGSPGTFTLSQKSSYGVVGRILTPSVFLHSGNFVRIKVEDIKIPVYPSSDISFTLLVNKEDPSSEEKEHSAPGFRDSTQSSVIFNVVEGTFQEEKDSPVGNVWVSESGGPTPPSASGSSSGSGSGSNERISSAGEENSESLGNSN